MDSRCIIFLLTVSLSCNLVQSSDDFLSQVLMNTACSGIVTEITSTDEGVRVVGAVKDSSSTPLNDSIQVVRYTWNSSATPEEGRRQCDCGGHLLAQLNNGTVPAPSTQLCTDDFDVQCTPFCSMNSNNADASSSCDLDCIIAHLVVDGNAPVVVLIAGLDCTVVRRYTQDICRFVPPVTDGRRVIGIIVGVTVGVGVAVGVVGTTVVAVIVCCIWHAFHRRRLKASHDKEAAHTSITKDFTVNNMTETLGNRPADPMVSQHHKEIFGKMLTSSANVRIIGELGEGAFCKVHSAVLVSEETGYRIEKHVAVKHLKANSTPEQVEEFISESAIMLNFDHPNVLHLLGVCFDTEDHFPLIILPLMSNGDLKSFLIRKRGDGDVDTLPLNLTIYHLLSMCLDIAKGMEYLAKMKYIHRDLAARNCMIDDKLHVKVADFGFSRDVYATQYYRLGHKTRLPVKWMPPESLLDNIYNERSDVWSYGVTCWEVFSLGRGPYPGVDNAEITDYISNGNRLKQPPLCPDDVYSILLSCWFHKSSERPNFSVLVEYLNRVIEHEPHPDDDDDRLQQNQDTQEFNRPYFVLEATSKAHCSANGSS